MSRQKKTRKLGSDVSVEPTFIQRSESDKTGRLRKKTKKRKGLTPGGRHANTDKDRSKNVLQSRDPRLGSKKPIALIIETSTSEKSLSTEQELTNLEKDPQLMVLLDRLGRGEKLGAGLQEYVNRHLDRIEVLMEKLGLLHGLDDEINNVENSDHEKKKITVIKQLKKTMTEEDELLFRLGNSNIEDFRG